MRYVAFLRAINVGSHVVKMERLREFFRGLGLAKVETFIASGNVIFESKLKAGLLETKLEAALHDSLGYPVATFLRSDAELRAVADHPAFPGVELSPAGNVLYVTFVRAAPSRESVAEVMTLRNEIDDFHVYEREIYWLRRRANGESKFSGARLEKMIGMSATARNLTTVNRLVAQLAQMS